MSPSIILHQSTKSIFVAYSERELTFEVNLPTNLGELTFKNTSKWVIDHSGVVRDPTLRGTCRKPLSQLRGTSCLLQP